MRGTILWFTGVVIILLVCIFLVPGSEKRLALDADKFFSGEYWRIVSYPFVHLNWSHLIENIVGLALVGFIAFELKTKFFDYSLTYFSSGILAVLPLWLIVSFIALGSSAAIYGLFGFVALGISKFGLKARNVLFVVVLVIFGRFFYSLFFGGEVKFYLIQALAHFSGLVFGLGLFFGLKQVYSYLDKKRRYILRGG